MENIDIEIIGKGNIGDKARQLLEKTPKLREIGFYTSRKTILAEDYFDEFFQRNGLGTNLRKVKITEDLEAKIRSGSLTKREFQVLQKISSSYENNPLVARSSAEGDSRGTGIYKTEFSENKISSIKTALKKVLISYFSKDAVTFRKDANLEEGFGIIIEPIIGQDFEGCFAPVISGFGYTSTSRGEGYINIVPGLGGGVESRDGERISRNAIQDFDGNLMRYIMEKRDNMSKVIRKSALLRTDQTMFSKSYSATAFFPSTRYEKVNVRRTNIDLEKELGEVFDTLNLLPFFANIDKMELSLQKPQYFEWAITIEGGKPKYWITQIAGIDKKLDIMDFEDFGEVLFIGHTVTGTGARECYKIADCWNPTDIEPLNKFNQNNKDYLLLFSSRLTTKMLSGDIRKLRYSDFNHASVFLEYQDAGHTGDPISHLGGQLDTTGKLFGVLDFDGEVPLNWQRVEIREKDENGIRVYQGKVKVLASERQNKMIVYALD